MILNKVARTVKVCVFNHETHKMKVGCNRLRNLDGSKWLRRPIVFHQYGVHIFWYAKLVVAICISKLPMVDSFLQDFLQPENECILLE